MLLTQEKKIKLSQRLDRIIQNGISRKNSPFFSGKYTGTDSALILLLRNLLMPERFINKLRYGQLFYLPSKISSAEPFSPVVLPGSDVLSWAKKLKDEGVVILPGYFQNEIHDMAARYGAVPDKYQAPKELAARYISLLDNNFLKIILSETMLSALGQTFNAQPFLQDIPVITIVDTRQSKTDDLQDEIVTEWHCDDINTLKILVFLTDVSKTGIRMRLAKRSHKVLRLNDALYSENYVQSKYEIVDCAGPKGTVVIFNSNALHKQHRVKGGFRVMLAAKYSPGNGLNFEKKYQSGYFELRKSNELFTGMPLSPLQKSAIRGILNCSSGSE